MKILMINGSPHPRGCTYTALHEMEQVLQAAGVETQILTVGASRPVAAPPAVDAMRPGTACAAAW